MRRVSQVRMSCVRVVLFAAVALALTAIPAQAASIGIIYRDYGIGKIDPGGNDALGTDWVTVSDQSSGRFYDLFDFSSLMYTSIESFQLTLTYGNTDDVNIVSLEPFLPISIPIPEDWRVRPAESTSVGSDNPLPALTRVGTTPISSTFTFNNTLDVFAGIINSEQFYLWFADEAIGANNFRLYSASLEVFGEPAPESVPDPGSSMLLFGIGLSFVAGATRLRRARQP